MKVSGPLYIYTYMYIHTYIHTYTHTYMFLLVLHCKNRRVTLTLSQLQLYVPFEYFKHQLLIICSTYVLFYGLSIIRIRERFVGMYTIRLGVLARDLEEL